MSKTHVIIPARIGSKRIHKKNMVLLGGKPLIEYTIQTAKQIKGIDRIVVSTDGNEIAEYAQSKGIQVMWRPDWACKDESTDFDVLFHYYQECCDEEEDVPDYMVWLAPTTPLRNIEVVQKAYDYYLQNIDSYDSLSTCQPLDNPPQKSFFIRDNILVPVMGGTVDEANKATQSFEQTYIKNDVFNIYSVDYFQRTNMLHGKSYAYITFKTIDIDTYEDLAKAEERLTKGVYK